MLFSAWWPSVLGILAVALLISGADDFIPLLLRLYGWLWKSAAAKPANASPIPERRIAIFVPCWRESGVIDKMIRHNLSAICYREFDFFLGVYPNDAATGHIARELAEAFGNVHVAECPHPGPTSKADCLNWVYRRMTQFEAEQAMRFETVVLHDAEDIIHPQALTAINRARGKFAMVQVPVLPLPTPFSDVTHGIYIDEFAEYQSIDMLARQACGAFLPSNGVGTGFAREILEQLARERTDLPFDPGSLTEDYEIGVYIHQAGYRQTFLPLRRTEQDFLATREYFPRNIRAAIRQRSRWITGHALQSWERWGWRGSWGTRYWFWRDRKGLVTNLLSVLANFFFISGLVDFSISAATRRPWLFAIANPHVIRLCAMTTALQCLRLTLRAICVGRIFGLSAALGVPLRCFHANLINCGATFCALRNFFSARMKNRTLVWQKTEHAYPNRMSLVPHRRELAEVLVRQGYLSEDQLIQMRAEQESGSALDLIRLAEGLIGEEHLCKALSLQSGFPAASVDVSKVNERIVRGLPARFAQRYGFLPFQVKAGKLLLAGTRVPPPEAFAEAEKLTALPVDFQLVKRSTFDDLRALSKGIDSFESRSQPVVLQ